MDEESETKTELLLEETVVAEESETIQDISENVETKEAETEEGFDDTSPNNYGSYEKTDSAGSNIEVAEGTGDGTGGVDEEGVSASEGSGTDIENPVSDDAKVATEVEVAGQELKDGAAMECGLPTSGSDELEEALKTSPTEQEFSDESIWIEDTEVVDTGKLNPSMPDRVDSPVKETQEAGEWAQEESSMSEEEHKTMLQDLQSENKFLRELNGQLQARLAAYFHRKAGEMALPERGKPVLDQEQRYLAYVNDMDELRQQHHLQAERYGRKVEEVQRETQERLDQADQEWQVLQALKREVAVTILSRQLGQRGAQNRVDQILAAQECKEKLMANVRLENVKLKGRTRRREAALDYDNGLAEGLHVFDFEQLKLENQMYREKIEDRNEELLKTHGKMGTNTQVLTHVKEKLHFEQAEARARQESLARAQAVVAQARDVVTRTKQARDRLRTDNARLRQHCGLLGNKALLRDMEETVESCTLLQDTLQELKSKPRELRRAGKGRGATGKKQEQ